MTCSGISSNLKLEERSPIGRARPEEEWFQYHHDQEESYHAQAYITELLASKAQLKVRIAADGLADATGNNHWAQLTG